MILGLLITWIFWIIMIGLSVYWKRSWANIIAIPVIISIIILIINLLSTTLSFWVPLILHIVIVLSLIVSIAKFKDKNDWKRPK